MTMKTDQNGISRRQALKALAAASGGLALGLIPKAWKKPAISVGVLPAHAQISPLPSCPDDMCATATTTTMVQGEIVSEYGDFDFSLCTPNDNYVWGGSSADGATSSPDNIDPDPNVDNETLNIITAIPGTYRIFLEHYEPRVPLEMTVEIITAAGVHTTTLTLTANRAVADVSFPGGVVTWRSDPGPPSCWNGANSTSCKQK